ncbi:hypothetical protein FE840_011850 [Peteryoungia desertarenae]|uniref:Uncharacterized protein n=1 Tax=Peteryoungia desertarenae TaxID=1813451 RepID=A0ABX6QNS1_9HYPH|nr:hypothetical protein [Peteryoungia desertarenae]QLF70175.1 hypothetical protein FE840_011850 [Peteryoungia desertarenae]
MSGCNITPLRKTSISSDKVMEFGAIVRSLMDEYSFHTEADVALAVAQFHNDEVADEFVIVANATVREYGEKNLLAVKALRDWAERNRPHLLTE